MSHEPAEHYTPGTAESVNNDASLVVSREQLTATTEPVAVGRARLEKYLVTEQRTVTLTLAREEVRLVYDTIDNTDNSRQETPQSPPADADSAQIVLYAEEPVITTRWVPAETAQLMVHTVTTDQTYTDTIRVEHLDTQIGTDLPPTATNSDGQ